MGRGPASGPRRGPAARARIPLFGPAPRAQPMDYPGLIAGCAEAAISDGGIGAGDARLLIEAPDEHLAALAAAAGEVTRRACGPGVDVEQLANIKKSACSEDCTFCAQSALYETGVPARGLPDAEEVVARAKRARDEGAASYCLVAAWREPTPGGFEEVCHMVSEIRRRVGIDVECSLGFLTPERARRLAGLGVRRYNHNLETSRSKFPDICTTHTYDDRLETLRTAREAGLELCTGGIIGMGETRGQRLELALELAAIRPEEVTVNILMPARGTPLELQPPLPAGEAERMFAVLRMLLPGSIIKVSGGRERATADEGRGLLLGGANGIITAGYLTTGGNDARRDAQMIRSIGLEA